MIIDCHGHYTTAPRAHTEWRKAQKAAFEAGAAPPPYPDIPDDDIRGSVEGSQIKLTKNDSPDGMHHLIPMSWVAKVHDHVHLNKDHKQVQAQWQPA